MVVPGFTTRNCLVPPGHTALTATPVRSKYRPSKTPSERFTLNTDFSGVALTVNGTVSSTWIATGTRPPSTVAVQRKRWNALTWLLGHDTELAGGLDGWTRNAFFTVLVTTLAFAAIVDAAKAGDANATTIAATAIPTANKRTRTMTRPYRTAFGAARQSSWPSTIDASAVRGVVGSRRPPRLALASSTATPGV